MCTGVGSYTDTTLSMSADATFRMLGLPVAAKATIDAQASVGCLPRRLDVTSQ